MKQIAYSVIDPHGGRWARLLDVDAQVKILIPPLVEQLDAPHELNYVLVPRDAEFPLNENFSLAQLRIPGGTELYLRPLRDQVLKMFLDKLYDEVKDNIQDRLLDLAKDKLRKILNLDPNYPDPLELRQQLFGSPPRAPVQKETAASKIRPVPKKIPVGWIIAGVLGGGTVLVTGGITVVALLVVLLRGGLGSGSGGNPPDDVVLGTGDVQVTLRWSAPVDLDLHLVDPYGEEIWYNNRIANSGGNLDVDANPACQSMMNRPVENVFWPYGSAPGGTYQVYIVYYRDCDNYGPVSYQLTIKQNDQVINTINDTISQIGEQNYITSFTR